MLPALVAGQDLRPPDAEKSLPAPLGTITVGAYDNHPKIRIEDDGSVSGFWPDLLDHLAAEEGWTVRYVAGTWQEGMARLRAAEIDLMPDVAFTPARAQEFTFCNETVLLSWTRLYVRQDSRWFESVPDLDGRTVAALRGSVNLEGPAGLREMAAAFGLSITYLELDDYDAVLGAVESGRADAGISNRNYGDRNASRFRVAQTPLIFQPANLRFALPRDGVATPALREHLDLRLAQLKNDPDSYYYELLARYFEAEVAEREVAVWPAWLSRLLQAAGLVLLMLMAAIGWSRWQVNRRTADLKASLEALRTGEQRYLKIFNAPADAIFIHDPADGTILEVNDPALAMYGVTREELVGNFVGTFSAGVAPYRIEDAAEHVRRAVTEGPQVFEWHSRRRGGELFWTEVSLSHTRIAGENRVLAVARDINSRKLAEADLAAERERLAVTLRSIGDAVITTDTAGRVALLNRVAEDLTGWPLEQARGLPLHEVFTIVDRKSNQPRFDPVRAVLESNAIVGLPNDTVLITRDGRRRLIADSGAPIRDAESRVVGVVLVFRDITDQARLESELLKVKKLESVGVLAGGIAHDFNNILAAVLGNLELALVDLDNTGQVRSLLGEAEGAVRRAEKLTKQLLTFARGGEPVLEAASLGEIVRESADFVLRGSSVACRYDLPADLWLVHSDPGQISQVVQNLVLNARHAMPDGGQIEITCRNLEAGEAPQPPGARPAAFVSLVIRDQGVGIPANIVERIFDPYFSTKQEGSGLGLAITHSIVAKHGGRIEVASQPGRGTTFTVLLPAATAAAAAATAVSEAPARCYEGRVLVMDDEEIVRRTTARMLKQLGFEVDDVADGLAAVDRFRSAAEEGPGYDLAIVDLTVPGGMGGREAARQILELAPGARVIVTSGYSNDRVMANFREYGFAGILAKPFLRKDLLRVLESVLG